MEEGWGKIQNSSDSKSKSKFGCIYLLMPQGTAHDAALNDSLITRKVAECEVIKLEVELLRAEEAKHSLN